MPKVLGIDLGTTNSCMAIIEGGERFGVSYFSKIIHLTVGGNSVTIKYN